jgi:EmrB/QacA subfamily drug resistance transporter
MPYSTTPKRGVGLAFPAIVVAMLPAVLDQTILATALPTVAAKLGRLSDVSWVVTAYVVSAAASTPLWGKLGDRHGRKLLLEIALVTFIGASALCGIAQSIGMLIALRAVQGAAAGGLMALAMAAVGDLVAPRERGRYQGYIAATFAVATVVGPLVGGLLVQHAGWRWVFYVNLPVGALALIALGRTLPAAATSPERPPIDAAGAGLIAAATAALMLACIWGGQRYAWGSSEIVGLIAGAVALGMAAVARERRAADPVVPLGMLRVRTVAIASTAMLLTTASLFAVTVFVPLFLQTTTGATPTVSGLLIVPMMIGVTVSTTLSGRVIARTGRYKAFPIAGLAVMALALGLLGSLAGHPSRSGVAIEVGLFGLGFGMVTQILVVAVQNSVEQRQLGTATAATNFFRGVGGAIGAAVLGAIFAAAAPGARVTEASVQAVAHAHRADVIHGAQVVFFAAMPIALVALLVALLLPEVPLRSQDAAGAGHASRPESGPRAAVAAPVAGARR